MSSEGFPAPPGAVVADHLWKRFRADERRWSARQQLRYARDRLAGRSDHHWRWVLRDLDFRIEPGQSVGLVGPNGSGKSTLLKILNGVMRPTAGRLTVAGRIGALIEVKAGLHPDLTGRENVDLCGSLLGLPRREVQRRFDRIVDFAELDDAIDRQVKHYSSGMQMRLGFSVAAHLDPEVLLIDEVLAVGDASFQQRCHDRMREVREEGTTLVLVSHDLAAVEATCDRCLFLLDGGLLADGGIREALQVYREWIEERVGSEHAVPGIVRLLKITAEGEDGASPRTDGPLTVRLVVENPEACRANFVVGVSEGPPTPIFLVRKNHWLPAGESEITCHVRHLPLPKGRFHVWVGVVGNKKKELLPWQPATFFDTLGDPLVRAPNGVVRLSAVQVGADWDIEERS